jgi:hypothetical protein
MPCRDDRDNYPSEIINEAKLLRSKVDNLTNMLCSSIRWMEEHDCDGDSVDEFLATYQGIKKWWAEHKKFDLARIAVDKLSKEERAALLNYIKKNNRLP